MELWIVTKYNDTTKFNNLIEIGSLFLQCFSEQNPNLAKQFGWMILMDFLEKWMAKGNIVSKLEKIYNSTSIRTNLPDMYLGFIGYAILVMRWTANTETYIKEYIDQLASQPQIMTGESQKIFQICQQYYNRLIKDQAKAVVENNRESIAKILWDKLRFDSASQNPELFLETSDFPHGIVDIANQGIMKTHDSLMAWYRIANEWAGKVNQLDFFLSLHRNRNNIALKKAYQEKIAKLPYFEWGSNKKGLIILENDQVLDIGSPASEKKYPKEFELCFLWEDEEFNWKLLESCMTPYITDMEINGSLLQTSPLQQGTKKYNIKPYLRKNQTPSSSNKDMLLAEVNKYILPEYEDLKERISQKESTLALSELPEYFWFLRDLHTQHIIVSQYTSPESFEIRVILSEYPLSSIIIRVGNGVLNCICIHNSVPIAEYESTKINLDRKNESTFYSGEPKIILSLKEQIRSFLIKSKREAPAHNFYSQLSENEKDVFLHKAAIWAFHFLLDTQEIGNARFTAGDIIYNKFYTPTKQKYIWINTYISKNNFAPIKQNTEDEKVFFWQLFSDGNSRLDSSSTIENIPDFIIYGLSEEDANIFWILAQKFQTANIEELDSFISDIYTYQNKNKQEINDRLQIRLLQKQLDLCKDRPDMILSILISNHEVIKDLARFPTIQRYIDIIISAHQVDDIDSILIGICLQQIFADSITQKNYDEILWKVSEEERVNFLINISTRAQNIKKYSPLFSLLQAKWYFSQSNNPIQKIADIIWADIFSIEWLKTLAFLNYFGIETDFEKYLWDCDNTTIINIFFSKSITITLPEKLENTILKRLEQHIEHLTNQYQQAFSIYISEKALKERRRKIEFESKKMYTPEIIEQIDALNWEVRDIEQSQRNNRNEISTYRKKIGAHKKNIKEEGQLFLASLPEFVAINEKIESLKEEKKSITEEIQALKKEPIQRTEEEKKMIKKEGALKVQVAQITARIWKKGVMWLDGDELTWKKVQFTLELKRIKQWRNENMSETEKNIANQCEKLDKTRTVISNEIANLNRQKNEIKKKYEWYVTPEIKQIQQKIQEDEEVIKTRKQENIDWNARIKEIWQTKMKLKLESGITLAPEIREELKNLSQSIKEKGQERWKIGTPKKIFESNKLFWWKDLYRKEPPVHPKFHLEIIKARIRSTQEKHNIPEWKQWYISNNYEDTYEPFLWKLSQYQSIVSQMSQKKIDIDQLKSSYYVTNINTLRSLMCIDFLDKNGYLWWDRNQDQAILDALSFASWGLLLSAHWPHADFVYSFFHAYWFIWKHKSRNEYITEYIKMKIDETQIKTFLVNYIRKNIRRLRVEK